jgi:hypothetical protein
MKILMAACRLGALIGSNCEMAANNPERSRIEKYISLPPLDRQSKGTIVALAGVDVSVS